MTPSQYISSLREALAKVSVSDLREIEDVLFDAWRHGRTIFIAGNGGSSSTASHWTNDLNKGAITAGGRRFRAMALTDNVPLITAWGNDTAYERIFVEQMTNFIQPHDVFVAISGSGNSPNILAAVQCARSAGAVTVGLTGRDGGQLRVLADHAVVVPAHYMEIIEDVHLALSHLLCTALRARIAAPMPAGEAIPVTQTMSRPEA
ncbi:MAG TPA: SIS domain-containing protein [bacterium]|nr:SIS domain-containing protein [bacterium]